MARIHNANDLMTDTPETAVSQPISQAQPIGIHNDPYAPGGPLGPVPYLPMRPDIEGPPTGRAGYTPPSPPPIPTAPPVQSQPAPVNPASPNPQPNNQAAPATTSGLPNLLDQMYVNPAPQPDSPKTLAELAMPGYKEPAEPPSAAEQLVQQMVSPQPDPAAASTPKTLAELALPGYKEPVTVTAQATVPVSPVVPKAITDLQPAYRTGNYGAQGYDYSEEQFAADLAIFLAGRPAPFVGPGAATDAIYRYEAARARLLAARYTPSEQLVDLKWAYFKPRNEQETLDRQAAIARLMQAGIPWDDPAVEGYLKSDKGIPVLTDPTRPVRWAAPPQYTAKQLQQELLRMNRRDVDFTEMAQDALVGMTVGPAITLWEAAHDEGDHSGWEIAGAAAMLGINILMVVPGSGQLVASVVKGLLRKAAPEFMAELAAIGSSTDAIQAARQLQTQQLLKDFEAYSQQAAFPARNVGIAAKPSPSPFEISPSGTVKTAPKGIEVLTGPRPEVPPTFPPTSDVVTLDLAAKTREIRPSNLPISDHMPLNPVLDQEAVIQLYQGPISGFSPAEALIEPMSLDILPRFGDRSVPNPAEFDFLQVGRGGDSVARGSTANNLGLNARELSWSYAAAKHIREYGKDLYAARPFLRSSEFTQWILDSTKAVPDPQGTPNAMLWKVFGSLGKSAGHYELIIDTETGKILHYMFEGEK
ncbi:hypothetical protein AB0L82_17795 [Nocardia sp. NPDC052001]|uniref:hypothetical protein n=1 Tax=Nocardia sp. NPDC052001 TaxID=3154853 RepID=UPI00343AF693